tara:strand:+ start:861 stop:2201 length:1341 start_codon:yes stop_codon:yes gene_type:complete
MKAIKVLKKYFNKSLIYEKKSAEIIGLRIFHLGIFFLSGAPSISFLLLTTSSIFASIKREDNYFNDKYNFPFLLASILMIINCIFITTRPDFINNIDPSLVWIGILNWLPFFWLFWSFQIYLKNRILRIQAAKFFLIGSFPVIFSGFTQYFLGWYGPFKFFNNLIIWYQRPLSDGAGVTGLFNNYNYAGAWLSIILALIIGLFFNVEKNKKLKFMILISIFAFIYMIILTTSRNALLASLLTFILLVPIKRFKFLFISLFTGLLTLIINLIPNLSSNVQNTIFTFLPSSLLEKIELNSLSVFNSFPRIELWLKAIKLIKTNLLIGYGGGSFSKFYDISNGKFEGMQHTHNIFLEIAFNYGLPCSILIIGMMLFILFKVSNLYFLNQNKELLNNNYGFLDFNKAWITSFLIFFFLHIFDITYFDGRISVLAWILLAGMRQIIKENIQ